MATCTITTNRRRTYEESVVSRSPATIEDEAGIDPGSTGDLVDDEPEFIDFWGSRDSLTCLANWG